MSEAPTHLDIEGVATHEAGHAVMAWLMGQPATSLFASEEGGYREGTGKRIRCEERLRICLAGIAAETGFGLLVAPNFSCSHSEDLDQCRGVIRKTPWIGIRADDAGNNIRHESEHETLARYYRDVCDYLLPYSELIDELSWRLACRRRLSGRSVAAIIREHLKREEALRRHAKLDPFSVSGGEK